MTRAVSIAQGGSNNVTMRNRIINGNMMIDQRNAGASVSIDNNEKYVVDRFFIRSNASGVSAMAQQSSVAPAGFKKSIAVNVTTGGTISASTRGYLHQRIEGFNVSDLGFGAAGATTVTVSFWVRSSITGTHSGALVNTDSTYSYPFIYTINSANTWEQKFVTVAGATSGTWVSDNGVGLQVQFDLGNGSDLRGPAGSWAAADYRGVTGAVSVFATTGASWYVTGVQLEAGTTATPFEQRLYGTELALCQRYYEKSYNIDVVPGTGSSAAGLFDGGVTSNAGSVAYTTIYYKVTKRANATVTGYSYSAGTAGSWAYDRNGGSSIASTVNFGSNGQNSTSASFNVGAAWAAAEIYGHWTASAEL